MLLKKDKVIFNETKEERSVSYIIMIVVYTSIIFDNLAHTFTFDKYLLCFSR